MTTAAFVLSLVSICITGSLGIAAFVFARIEYRRTGPLVVVELMRGYFTHSSSDIHVQDEQMQNHALIPCTRTDILIPPLLEIPLVGVYVRNYGRSAVNVRQIAIEKKVDIPADYLPDVWPDGSRRVKKPQEQLSNMLTTRFLTGSAFPARLEAHSSDYWMLSLADFGDAKLDKRAQFVLILDDGNIIRSKAFDATAHEAELVGNAYAEWRNKGSPSTDSERLKRGNTIMEVGALPPTPRPGRWQRIRCWRAMRRHRKRLPDLG